MAAAGDERYLVCAAVAAAVGLPFFPCRNVTVASSCFGCACACVVIGCFGICGCRSQCTTVICQQIFAILVLAIFLLKLLFEIFVVPSSIYWEVSTGKCFIFQNLRIDIGFEEMAALKHSLKIALHVYDALQNSLCFACRRSIPTEERRNIGLGYFKYGLCAGCFEALTTVCTEQDDTLAEQRCVALTDDGVHAAAMLLSAYRAGAGCRLSQADAAWVRNVIADSENFLPHLLREVP